MKPQNEKPNNHHLDSRTSEERKNEPKSVTTYASKEPKNKDWEKKLIKVLSLSVLTPDEVGKILPFLIDFIRDILVQARAEERRHIIFQIQENWNSDLDDLITNGRLEILINYINKIS